MQTESIAAPEEFAARHIKVVIKSGYDNFSAIYRISASGGSNLFTTKVDTNFSFGSNSTKFNSSEPAAAPKTQSRQKAKLDDDQQAYSFNNPPAPPKTALSSALSDGANPEETEEAGFQSTFRLPNDPSFGKRKQDSVASLASEDGSGEEEDPSDDDAYSGVGGVNNWQM